MKVYYIMKLFGELQNMGHVDIIKYHQISGGWHVVIRDNKDGNEYEMNIIPRQENKDKVGFPSFMLN